MYVYGVITLIRKIMQPKSTKIFTNICGLKILLLLLKGKESAHYIICIYIFEFIRFYGSQAFVKIRIELNYKQKSFFNIFFFFSYNSSETH